MSETVLSTETTSAPRRKSGRVSKKPEHFVPASSPAGSAKRKRADANDSDADTDASPSEEEQASSEGEPDEEELREQRRKNKGKAKGKSAARKPAPKKPKTNGQTLDLAIRPAASKPKKYRKPTVRKSALGDDEADGLYAEVFARSSSVDDVAAQWVGRFQQHAAKAVAEVVNFVLRASGCTLKVNEDDIADPDNCQNRLEDIQDEYQAQEVSDYPLLAKNRGAATFKNTFQAFFAALVQTLEQNGLLYEESVLMENIQVWVSTLASCQNRPFRHTGTVASMAITTTLARIANDIVETSAKKIRQSESESKKSRVNKARVVSVNNEIEELNDKREIVDAMISDWFDTVYIHRYRDIHHTIRVECVEALATWITVYPDKFFDGTHLRYLGWILSDPSAPTRVEVLKQLQKLFHDKDKLAGLKTFTERYRPRIVEIATRDAETNVRAAGVELLDVLREAGFLEPDDIDSVGKLIFDAEPKVRKAVVGFFAEVVNGAYEQLVDDLGGKEAIDDALATTEEDAEYQNPRLEWLKLKSLVDQLLAYDEEDAQLPSQIERIPPAGAELGLIAAGIESRFSLAAQTLYDTIPEIRDWEVIVGYLLYDHSQTVENESDDAETMLRLACKTEDKQETALLDILNVTVRTRLRRLAEAEKDKKKTRAQREANKEEQADTTRRLSVLIPQLLKKFGALPEAASLCLRLERELNLDVFQELRQTPALTALLDDINKQFLTHHHPLVLNEAVGSMLHAQMHEETRELSAPKVRATWDDLINTFDALRRGRDFSARGNMETNILNGVGNIVMKMAWFAQAYDSTILDQMTTPPANARSKSRTEPTTTPPIATILQILNRGVATEALDPATSIMEDELVHNALTAMMFYMLWKYIYLSEHVKAGTRIPDEDLVAIAERRDGCVKAAMHIMETRKGADELRLHAAGVLIDVYSMFYKLREIRANTSKASSRNQILEEEQPNDDWEALCQEVDAPTTKTLLQVLTAAEQNLAKRTGRRLEDVGVDDDPIDPDDEPESSDDEEADERMQEEKMMRALLAEKRLCGLGGFLVRGVLVGALDGENTGDAKPVRTRLEKNKTKLGHDWKEVVAHLDIVKTLKAKGGRKAKAATAKQPAKPAKSKEIVIEDDSEDDELEVRGDEIEDEEMADGDEQQVNGDVHIEEEAEEPGSAPDDVESVLGD
ncbi:hypothetical protein BDV95DRAFT_489918 [Massariosphaeria phaeospora]|uniref:SCD domain-containing protein n=1 Tax=Massariosphaeria phaeospora TaxID=100035 RepID=A0A7C8ICD1_9PLEO|nr:hypothetical protein BDV95DRAFT_489918 [Massariosphaeria phaeospora]